MTSKFSLLLFAHLLLLFSAPLTCFGQQDGAGLASVNNTVMPTATVVKFVSDLPKLNAEPRSFNAKDGRSFLKSRKNENGFRVPFVRLDGSEGTSNCILVYAFGDAKEIEHLEFRLRCETNELLDRYKLRLASRIGGLLELLGASLPAGINAELAKIDSPRRNRSATVFQDSVNGFTLKVRYYANGNYPPVVSMAISANAPNEAVAYWIDQHSLKTQKETRQQQNEKIAAKIRGLNQENLKLTNELTEATRVNRNAHGLLKDLQRDTDTKIAKSKAKIESNSKPAAPAFEHKNVTINRGQFGSVELIGELTNSSGNDYQMASFNIVLYDANMKLISVEAFTLSDYRNGATKAFSVPVLKDLPADTKFRIELDSSF